MKVEIMINLLFLVNFVFCSKIDSYADNKGAAIFPLPPY